MTRPAAQPWLSSRARGRGFAAGMALLSLAAPAFVLGCGATCDRDRDEEPRPYRDGITTGGVYETSPWEGPYIDFKKGRTFRLFHDLGAPPRDIDPWLAFDDFPIPPPGEERIEGYSNAAPCAGNQCIIEEVTAEYIDIRNDTCSDVWLRLVASAPNVAPGGGSDASAGAMNPDGGGNAPAPDGGP